MATRGCVQCPLYTYIKNLKPTLFLKPMTRIKKKKIDINGHCATYKNSYNEYDLWKNMAPRWHGLFQLPNLKGFWILKMDSFGKLRILR